MGMPLPAGVRLLAADRPELVPWAWGINGALSVIGATLAVFIAMNWGFSVTLVAGGSSTWPRPIGAITDLPISRSEYRETRDSDVITRSEVLLVARAELVPRIRMALSAQMLQRIGRGHAAHPRAHRRRARPSAIPFMNPPRNASPTPVGSTIAAGGTAGTSMRPSERDHRAAVLASRHDERLAAARISASSSPSSAGSARTRSRCR